MVCCLPLLVLGFGFEFVCCAGCIVFCGCMCILIVLFIYVVYIVVCLFVGCLFVGLLLVMFVSSGWLCWFVGL